MRGCHREGDQGCRRRGNHLVAVEPSIAHHRVGAALPQDGRHVLQVVELADGRPHDTQQGSRAHVRHPTAMSTPLLRVVVGEFH